MNRPVSALVIALVLGSVSTPAQKRPATPSSHEFVTIDGSKNPELIPQWNVWGFVFRIIAGGPRQLPSEVLAFVSSEEAAMVLREADAVQKIDAACHQQLLKIYSTLDKEKPESVDARLHAREVECRRETINARNRVLEALNPEGAAALVAFAESKKSGMNSRVPRDKYARFFEPE